MQDSTELVNLVNEILALESETFTVSDYADAAEAILASCSSISTVSTTSTTSCSA